MAANGRYSASLVRYRSPQGHGRSRDDSGGCGSRQCDCTCQRTLLSSSAGTRRKDQRVLPMKITTRPVTLTINGRKHGPLGIAEGMMMIDFLSEYVNLTGSRLGCGQGVCHACVVIEDRPDGSSHEMRTCITGAHYFDGKVIRTVEGHASINDKGEEVPSPVQQAFMDHYSFQCGYCTPGFVN